MSLANQSKRLSGTIISAIFLACWNLISLFVGYWLIKSVYNNVPELKKKDEKPEKEKIKYDKLSNFYKGWIIYFKQGVFCLPGISLAILYLTVLSFDSITIGYAKSQEISESLISILQGLGAIFGVFGTFGFSFLHNKCKLKLPATGLIGSIGQITCLILCVISIWLPGSPFELNKNAGLKCNELNRTKRFNNSNSAYDYFFLSSCRSYTSILMLLISMAISRFGLWLFDLSVNQIIQESVPKDQRGIVGGVQNSLNQIFELIKFGLVIILPTMPKYGYLVIISFFAVFTGFILLTIFTFLIFFKKTNQINALNNREINASFEKFNEIEI